MASNRITASSARALSTSLHTVAVAGLALAAPLAAQDIQAPPSLEDLIPDSAVENPDGWAQDGTEGGADTAESAIDPESQIDVLPDTGPEALDDLALPEFEPLDEEEAVEFADLELSGPTLTFADAEIERISNELVLGFPQAEPPFTSRGDFVERFRGLSTIRELESGEENLAQLSARAREDEELLGDLLRVYGFYDARVIRTIGSREVGEDKADDAPLVRFDIVPNERYRFGAIDLGSLNSAPDAEALRAAFEIQSGDFLQSDTIVEEQQDLDIALGETGYPFAAIDEPELLIDHDRREGDLTMPVQPNGKYVFGDVVSDDPRFLSGRHLATIARFRPGDTYQRSLEMDLRRAVTATGLVSSVSVKPREVTPPQGDQPGVVAMDVSLERAKLRTIAGAIGYGSEEGFRLQASWEHRNFFPPEGALKIRGIAGTQEQLAGVSFRKNNFGGRDRILNVDAYASTIDSPAFDARTVALIATYERQSTLLFQKPISWSAGIELIATSERPAALNNVVQPRETFFVAALPGFAQIDTSDDLLNPTKGFRVGVRLSPEVSRNNGAESFYLRGRADASYYQQIGEGTVLAGRVAYGAIPGAPLQSIAPSRRFYAGGGGSVRGYGFREIGPRDALGDPTGGRSVVEGAVEARIRTGFFDGALSVVPFVDAGSVSTSVTPDFKDIRFGAGVGVRYLTGFGPLRLDVGFPLNPRPEDSFVAVYVSLGQAF